MESNKTISYELRGLTAEDIFPMFNIISKIGIKEFKTCFESPEIKKAISNMSNKDDSSVNAIGITVAFDIVGIVMTNLPRAKEDIYSLLASLSGMNKKDIADLPLVTFTQMIIDVIRKDEFKDFFQVVSKLFK